MGRGREQHGAIAPARARDAGGNEGRIHPVGRSKSDQLLADFLDRTGIPGDLYLTAEPDDQQVRGTMAALAVSAIVPEVLPESPGHVPGRLDAWTHEISTAVALIGDNRADHVFFMPSLGMDPIDESDRTAWKAHRWYTSEMGPTLRGFYGLDATGEDNMPVPETFVGAVRAALGRQGEGGFQELFLRAPMRTLAYANHRADRARRAVLEQAAREAIGARPALAALQRSLPELPDERLVALVALERTLTGAGADGDAAMVAALWAAPYGTGMAAREVEAGRLDPSIAARARALLEETAPVPDAEHGLGVISASSATGKILGDALKAWMAAPNPESYAEAQRRALGAPDDGAWLERTRVLIEGSRFQTKQARELWDERRKRQETRLRHHIGFLQGRVLNKTDLPVRALKPASA